MNQQPNYKLKDYNFSSHILAHRMLDGEKLNILDIGCGPGAIETISENDFSFTGIDISAPIKSEKLFRHFICHDLKDGLPINKLPSGSFDYILLLDILEHMPEPEKLLKDVLSICDENTKVIVSLPNFINIYVRAKVFFGLFDYDEKGILDKSHLRFFTSKSAFRMFDKNGFTMQKKDVSLIPFQELFKSKIIRGIFTRFSWILRTLTLIWPSLFAYQYIFLLKPASSNKRS